MIPWDQFKIFEAIVESCSLEIIIYNLCNILVHPNGGLSLCRIHNSLAQSINFCHLLCKELLELKVEGENIGNSLNSS